MSFGTFQLFNFYQQPNTGTFPQFNNLYQIAGPSGDVADFNWPFPYSGTSVPIEIVKGGGGAFQLKLFSDTYLTDDSGNPITFHYGTATSNFSGNFQGDSNSSSAYGIISGSFNPMDSGFSNSYAIFSGFISGAPQDSPINYIVLSGLITNQQPDFGFPFLVFSGMVVNDQPDSPVINSIISGVITDADYSNPTLTTVLSGVFIPSYQDNTCITYGFLGMTTYNNVTVTSTGFINSANIKYGFSSFISIRGA